MPLAEVLTIEVGASIAKWILKRWLKDSPLGDNISSNIIDVLKAKTSDILAAREGNRQFEKIGEQVGKTLIPLFEREGAQLDEGSKVAVAYEVATAFDKSRLSSELLAKLNLEPTELARHVLAGHIVDPSFSEDEKALYERIIQVSCSYIVDIASQLPTFNERTFAEVLQREDQLIAIARQLLDESRRIRELLPTTDAGKFEGEYREGIVRKLDWLELFGTDVSIASKRHRLSVAYITLSVEQEAPAIARQVSESSPMKEVESVFFNEEIDRGNVSVDVALANAPCLLIRGEPGSGKTTLLQWIAIRSALKTFDGPLSTWNDTIPFFIRLRECRQQRLPAPENFPRQVVSEIAGAMPQGWVHDQLKSGRALVLIDGVDEVSETRRNKVRAWLKGLVETFPQSRFIVTSRSYAAEEGWMEREGFSDAELQPMQLADINAFIDHWHNAVREELREEEEKARLQSLAEQLKNDIKRFRPLRNLATNPLLCAMLCALNRDRRQHLPADRIELYDACCYLLLERRDKERQVELADYPALTYRKKRLLLEDLAYWMIRNEWSEVTVDEADQRFDRKLTDMPGLPQDISGTRVRQLFVERSGMIREPVAGRVDFTHRTFQEFLAANAAKEESDIGLLVEKAHNDQWREVIILAAGLMTKQMRESLIKGLIERGDLEPAHRYQLHLLAVSCLETSLELGSEVRQAVEQRLSQLVPPKNMTDAKALAAAGEPAVKYLAKGRYSATTAAACVRALCLIGGDEALTILEGYANDFRSRVVDELVRGWDSFDRETYARNILSQTMRHWIGFSFSSLPSLEGFEYFTNLTGLTLLKNSQVKDLSPLARLANLTDLGLSGCSQMSDLGPLANLTDLTDLSLSGCSQMSDLSSLANLTNLTDLSLSGCEQMSDLSPLANLTNLTDLSLSGCSQMGDLSPLTNLTNLTSLDLSECSQVSDLSPLANLTSLTSLSLSGCSQVSDLSPLANLTNLTTLSLPGCEQTSDLRPLENLTNLTSLDLSECSQVSELEPLARLTNLRTLNLSECSQVSDLSPLTTLTNLKKLYLFACFRVISVSVLEKMQNIEEVMLDETAFLRMKAPKAFMDKLLACRRYNSYGGTKIYFPIGRIYMTVEHSV